ncbi:MAG: RdgB/HAM1 family non-canonical purine NTP pyrophosphatase [Spirochaetaceae bacterium]|jgi:XTP/dITP diphosphohydrolase|nr:RdgB/HAM1 family non-canonical purine NTP pyrophosphatase [Spirochaetaceae bacterium]
MALWFASNNPHKAEELQSIFNDTLIRLGVPISDIQKKYVLRLPAASGIQFDPAETGLTFMENALLKAQALYALVHEPVIADDSGLCVDALNGLPGIYSARYRGNHIDYASNCKTPAVKLNDGERNAILIREMEGQPNRRARFVCAMVCIGDEKRRWMEEGTLEGQITEYGRGTGGFGYDPLLFLPDFGKTVAELDAHEKNNISHRAQAGIAIARHLPELPLHEPS